MHSTAWLIAPADAIEKLENATHSHLGPVRWRYFIFDIGVRIRCSVSGTASGSGSGSVLVEARFQCQYLHDCRTDKHKKLASSSSFIAVLIAWQLLPSLAGGENMHKRKFIS